MRLYFPLPQSELDLLRDLARVERRRPQDQASVLLSRALAETVRPPAPPAHTDGVPSSAKAHAAVAGDHPGSGRG